MERDSQTDITRKGKDRQRQSKKIKLDIRQTEKQEWKNQIKRQLNT